MTATSIVNFIDKNKDIIIVCIFILFIPIRDYFNSAKASMKPIDKFKYWCNIFSKIKRGFYWLQQKETLILKGLWLYPFILTIHVIIIAWFRTTDFTKGPYTIINIFLTGVYMAISFYIFVYITLTPDEDFMKLKRLFSIFGLFIAFIITAPIKPKNEFFFNLETTVTIAMLLDLLFAILLEASLHNIDFKKINKAEWITFWGTIITAIIGMIGTIASAIIKK